MIVATPFAHAPRTRWVDDPVKQKAERLDMDIVKGMLTDSDDDGETGERIPRARVASDSQDAAAVDAAVETADAANRAWLAEASENGLTALEEKGVTVLNLPPEEQKKITQIAMDMWEKEGEKGPEAAKALQMLKDYLKSLGHL